MNRAFIFLATLAVLNLPGGQSIAKTQKPSEEMGLVIAHHKTSAHELDMKGLALDNTMTELFASKMPDCEVLEIPSPANVDDAFSYKIYLHIPSGRYWIYQEGGFGGVSEFYGPGSVKKLRK
jgi:hypothetical protein